MRALEVLLAVLLGLAFVLPWLDLGFGQAISGLEMLRATLDANGRMGSVASFSDMEGGWVVYLFWALPIGLALTLVTGAIGVWWARVFALLTGLVPWLLLALIALDLGSDFDEVFRFFAVGAWATLGIGLLLILTGLGLLRLPGRR